MNYLRVKNWEKFQQYKDREPKWIKLHRGLNNNYEWSQLDEAHRAHLIGIWLLAAELDNKIPNDPSWIASKICAKKKVDLKQLVTSGFLESYRTVQNCTDSEEVVYLETEEETEEETETEKKTRATAPPENLVITKDMKNWAVEKSITVNLSTETEKFLDYYRGKGETRKDWVASWRNWMRNAQGYAAEKNPTPNQPACGRILNA